MALAMFCFNSVASPSSSSNFRECKAKKAVRWCMKERGFGQLFDVVWDQSLSTGLQHPSQTTAIFGYVIGNRQFFHDAQMRERENRCRGGKN